MKKGDEALESIILAGRALLVKMLITLEPHRIFGSNFVHLCTLPLTPNWSPYIFTLVQKVKLGHKKSCLYKQTKALPRLWKLFNLKMTCTFCTDDVRVKVPSFQKVAQFVQYKTFQGDIICSFFCLF